MDANDFIHYLTNDGTFKLNAEEDGYERPWEIEPAKRLFDAFKEIGNIVNSTSTPNGEVAARALILGTGHRTLEQSTVRMMFQIIEYLAKHQDGTDPRNESSRKICKELVELFEAKHGEGNLPSMWLGSI